MNEPFFKPEDFVGSWPFDDSKRSLLLSMLDVCNNKLEKALGPEMFGLKIVDKPLGEGIVWQFHSLPARQGKNYTHTARLFNVQEIKKEHICKPSSPSRIGYTANYEWVTECECGKKLKAKWEVAE